MKEVVPGFSCHAHNSSFDGCLATRSFGARSDQRLPLLTSKSSQRRAVPTVELHPVDWKSTRQSRQQTATKVSGGEP
jgi:hypothetical protein